MTADMLRSLLKYDPDTGVFSWAVQLSPVAPVGSVAGSIYKGGHRYIAIGCKRYLAHRLAWLYVYGEWPVGELDHRNVNGDDNRIANLRLATDSQNSANRHANAKNKLGVKGVGVVARVRKPPHFRSRIRVGGRLIHLGYYATSEQANRAYANAAAQYFGEFARSA